MRLLFADIVFNRRGVGYSWIDGLKNHANETITDEQLAGAAQRYPIDTPETQEAYMIRQIFEGHFPTDTAAETAVRWIPRAVSTPNVAFAFGPETDCSVQDWGCAADPSGRAVAIHEAAYE